MRSRQRQHGRWRSVLSSGASRQELRMCCAHGHSMAAEGSTEAPISLLDALPPHLVEHVFREALRQHVALLQTADPDDLLQLRKRDPRRTLPLVSKRFLEAASDADCLWARVQLNLLTLTADAVPRLLRWLSLHAPAIRCLVLHGRALPNVAAALSRHVDELAVAVQQARGITQLDLPRALGVPVLARLQPDGLPRLRAVGVDLLSTTASTVLAASGARGEVEQAAANLLALPALTELRVQSSFQAALLACQPARQLRRLHWSDASDLPAERQLAALACMTCLTSLRLCQREGSGWALPGPLTALPGLALLHASVRYPDEPLLVSASISQLSSLRGLWLQHATFEQPASLAALPTLQTLGLVGGSAAYPAVLAALRQAYQQQQQQQQAQQERLPLRALHLEAHAGATSEVPADTWHQLSLLPQGLTRLELPYNRLQALPAGDYLSSLRVLDLAQNSLPGVPLELAACCSLTALSLGQQEAAALGGSDADVAVLAALPALRVLVSSSGHYSSQHLSTGLRSPVEAAHLQRLRAALPDVRVTNQQAEFERAAGRLQALFDVSLRQDRL